MATKLDDTQRPLYVDSVALKALINRIGVLRESLREEMKHLNVEVDSSKFITKELFDAHIEDYNQFKLSTTTKLTEITEILSRMVSPDDVEEAYTEAYTGIAKEDRGYHIKTYGVYGPFLIEEYGEPLTASEMEAIIEDKTPDRVETIMFKDGIPFAIMDNIYGGGKRFVIERAKYLLANGHLNGQFGNIFTNFFEVGTDIPFADRYYIYKLESRIPVDDIDGYDISPDDIVDGAA